MAQVSISSVSRALPDKQDDNLKTTASINRDAHIPVKNVVISSKVMNIIGGLVPMKVASFLLLIEQGELQGHTSTCLVEKYQELSKDLKARLLSPYTPRGGIERLKEDLQAPSQHAKQFKGTTQAKEDYNKLRLLRERCKPECRAQEVAGECSLYIEETNIRSRSWNYK